VDHRWSSYSRSYTRYRRGHISCGQTTNQDRLLYIVHIHQSSSSAVFSHIRTRHAFTHTYTPQTEDSYHSEDHPTFTPGESTCEDRYIFEVKPSEDQEKVLGRTKCSRSFGQMIKWYHFVLGLNAIQVHKFAHTSLPTHNQCQYTRTHSKDVPFVSEFWWGMYVTRQGATLSLSLYTAAHLVQSCKY